MSVDPYAGQEGPLPDSGSLRDITERLKRIERLLVSNELQPVFRFYFDGDDSAAEQLVNLRDALDGLKAGRIVVDYILVEGA